MLEIHKKMFYLYLSFENIIRFPTLKKKNYNLSN